MVYPCHLKPLPSIISTPWQYYQVIHTIVTVEHLSDLRLALFEELGGTEAFFKLFLHISKDVLKYKIQDYNLKKPTTDAKVKDAFDRRLKDIISLNPKKNQEVLYEYCKGVQNNEEGSQELIKFI